MSGVQGDHPPAGVWGGAPNSCAAAQKRERFEWPKVTRNAGRFYINGERGDARCATREAAQAAGARTAEQGRRSAGGGTSCRVGNHPYTLGYKQPRGREARRGDKGWRGCVRCAARPAGPRAAAYILGYKKPI